MNIPDIEKNKLGIDAIGAFLEQFDNSKDNNVKDFLLVLLEIMLEQDENFPLPSEKR